MNTLRVVVFVFIGLYVLVGLGFYFLQESIIFLPDDLDKNHQYQLDVPFQERYFKTEAGVQINALHLKADSAKGVIYYHHGNAQNLARWSLVAQDLVQLGYDILIYDYRGYGKSTGTRTSKRLFADAQFIYDWLLEFYPEDQIIVYGRSLGTGLASYIAAGNNPAKVILETPFYSMSDMANRIAPIYPIKYLLRFHFPSNQFLSRSSAPAWIIHGDQDEVVPFESGYELYESLKYSHPIQHITIEGGHHNDLSQFPTYWTEIERILE